MEVSGTAGASSCTFGATGWRWMTFANEEVELPARTVITASAIIFEIGFIRTPILIRQKTTTRAPGARRWQIGHIPFCYSIKETEPRMDMSVILPVMNE